MQEDPNTDQVENVVDFYLNSNWDVDIIVEGRQSTSEADEDDTKIYDLYDEARTNNPSTPARPDSKAGKRDDAMRLLEEAFRGRPLQRSIPLKADP